MLQENLAVVIRTSGEKTFDTLYRQILSASIKEEFVSVVSFEPFEKTLAFSYQNALAMNKPWTLIIDADILLGFNLSQIIHKAIKKSHKDDLGFALRVFDKFYNSPKYRGLHVYQTKHLEKALFHIPIFGQTLRPETYVKGCMQKEGHNWLGYKNIMGLHDFFQNPYDIFCKMAVRAHRSKKDIKQLLIYYDKKINQGDKDFLFAKEGLKLGSSLRTDEIDNSRIRYQNYFTDIFDNVAEPNNSLDLVNFNINKILIKKIIRYSPKNSVKNFFTLY